MKRHAFDPFSFVFGLAVTGLGLYFLIGNRSAADLGATWLWPFPVLLIGLMAVMYAVRRMRWTEEAAPADRSRDDLDEAAPVQSESGDD